MWSGLEVGPSVPTTAPTLRTELSVLSTIPTCTGREATTGPELPRRGILGIILSQCDEACDFEQKGIRWAVSATFHGGVVGRPGALCSSLSGRPDVRRAGQLGRGWGEQGLVQSPLW